MEIDDLIQIGRLKINSKKGGLLFTPLPEFKHLYSGLIDVFLIFKDYRVRYGKIDISANKTVNICDDELFQELHGEEEVIIGIDNEELKKIESENEYFDPVGMKVIYDGAEVATIDNFFFNGAHDVYELLMNDGKIVLIPDVENFVVETNVEKRFIRVVDLDQFFF